MPGVLLVLIEKGFAGVVAVRRRQAWRAADALDCEWSGGATLSAEDIPSLVTAKIGSGAIIQDEGVHVCCEAGRLVNLNVSGSQVEGGISLGLSWAAYEQSEMRDGIVFNASFHQYHMMPPSEAPETHVHFLQEPVFRQGLNEIPAGLIAPSVANAIFALTGERQRSTPLRLTVPA